MDNTGTAHLELTANSTYIGENAFYRFNAISSVSLPKTLAIIRDNAFNCCECLLSIEIPDGV
jgi:hypothetical protein